MADRDLVVGVLAVQAGFVSPADVIAVASAAPAGEDGDSLATRLEATGALTAQRRQLIDAMADEAFAMHGGDAQRALESLGGEAVLSRTFGESLRAIAPRSAIAAADAERAVPEERPGQYTRLGEIGRGGQSVVHCAVDE